MKKYNNFLSILSILAFSLSCVSAHAAQISNATDALVDLELEQGQFVNAADTHIKLAIDTYFDFRQDSYSFEKSLDANSMSAAKSTPLTQSKERNVTVKSPGA